MLMFFSVAELYVMLTVGLFRTGSEAEPGYAL